jgi:ubiquinone/menaquinone biosynthesis C-methylase UbiE
MPQQRVNTWSQSDSGTLNAGNSCLENADVHASSAEYAERFSGSVGQWMLQVQEAALVSMIANDTESVLDIGGGHGQTAKPLYKLGKSVTVLGSSPSCTKQILNEIEAGVISFKTGNLIELPYNARSFDTVISFRLMSHCSAWRTLIAEMCRVADQKVIFDYPVWFSANILTPLLFRIKRRIEGNTRRYTIFTTSELCDEFLKYGFVRTAMRKQFLLPMGIHRAIKSPLVSKTLEGAAKLLGITALFGSPVIIRFERVAGNDE